MPSLISRTAILAALVVLQAAPAIAGGEAEEGWSLLRRIGRALGLGSAEVKESASIRAQFGRSPEVQPQLSEAIRETLRGQDVAPITREQARLARRFTSQQELEARSRAAAEAQADAGAALEPRRRLADGTFARPSSRRFEESPVEPRTSEAETLPVQQSPEVAQAEAEMQHLMMQTVAIKTAPTIQRTRIMPPDGTSGWTDASLLREVKSQYSLVIPGSREEARLAFDMSGQDLSAVDWRNFTAEQLTRILRNANLSRANLGGYSKQLGVIGEAVDLGRIDLSGADLTNLEIFDIQFRGANLRHANFSGSTLTRVLFGKAEAAGYKIETELNQAIMHNTLLVEPRVDGAKLGGIDTDGSRWDFPTFVEGDMRGFRLPEGGVRWKYNRPDFGRMRSTAAFDTARIEALRRGEDVSPGPRLNFGGSANP